MRDRLDRLDVPVDVALVTFTTPDRLDDYQRRQHVPFPILLDPYRSTYGAYGLGRGSFLDVWGWNTMKKYGSLLNPWGRRSGFGDLAPATEDTRQLGGDFVVTPDGRLAWGYWSTGPSDRPGADEIIGAVHAAGARR